MIPDNKQSFGNVIVGIVTLLFVAGILYTIINNLHNGISVIGIIFLIAAIVLIALPAGFAGVYLICSYISFKRKKSHKE